MVNQLKLNTGKEITLRLRTEMAADPDRYFARKEIARTDDDLARCATEIVNIYQTMRILEKKNAWWRDDTQCEATFRCQYTPICYGDVDCSGGFTPENFRRLSDATRIAAPQRPRRNFL